MHFKQLQKNSLKTSWTIYLRIKHLDFSKTYDRLPCYLLIAKHEWYGPDKPSLNLVNDYFNFQKQSSKTGSSYSYWADVPSVIPQRSLLGPLLFKIFINDVFLFIWKRDVYKFAENNALLSCGNNLWQWHDMKIVVWWFNFNSLKSNSGKFQFVIYGKSLQLKYCLTIESINVKESDYVKL